jgi:hypothetical protein
VSAEQIPPDDARSYLEIAKMRETAEAVHGRETIERVTGEYRRLRAELQAVTRPPSGRRDELQLECGRLERTYGYEVLAGVPRITRGDHPRHDWTI